MSLLTLSSPAGSFRAKVTAFSTPLQTSIRSSQTRNSRHHFPLASGQGSLSLTLLMRNYSEQRRFVDFVRRSQKSSLSSSAPLVNLFWPERGIYDWTGAILSVQEAEKVGTTSPSLSISLLLVDSLLSQRTWISSSGSDIEEIYKGEVPDLPVLDPEGGVPSSKIDGVPNTPPSSPPKTQNSKSLPGMPPKEK